MRAPIAKAVLAACTLVFTVSAGNAAEEPVLNVYNWSDYIAKDTLEKFTKETGIKVNYDVYDDNAVLEAKLMAGKSGYDVVFPSAMPHFAQMVRANVFQKLDRAKLNGFGGIDPTVMKTLEASDPGNQFGVPYMIAATGIGFNIDKVKSRLADAPTDSWAMLFDPKVVGKLQDCGVTLLDTPIEVFPAALVWQGKDGASQSKDDLKAAAQTVNKVRPMLKYIHSSSYINDLANGDICVAHGYVGDLVQARARAAEAGKGVNIGIAIPKEGAVVNIDVMAVPADAPHPENAHKFINFLLRPEIIAEISNEVGYANAVPGAAQFMIDEIKNDPVIFPPKDVLAKEFMVPPAAAAFERDRTREWTRIKTRY